MKLLTIGNDAKTIKGEALGYKTAIIYGAPAMISGHQACAGSSPGCREACLYKSGHGVYNSVQQARIARTKLYFEDRQAYFDQWRKELDKFIRYCDKRGWIPVHRPNGTTDIPYERIPVPGTTAPNIMALYPKLQMYDYTKLIGRLRKPLPANYHLTFSLAENNGAQAWEALTLGFNVAAVFSEVPKAIYWGPDADWFQEQVRFTVIDGDKTDLRFTDPEACIVGLKAKGPALKDKSGFVRNPDFTRRV